MLISKNWLKDFVFLPDNLDPAELSEELTMKVFEVEGYEAQKQALENVVVGEISSMEQHPDADKLKVCMVDVGEKEHVQIICGGSNLKKGMKVALGKVGAKVRWHGEGDLIELTPAKIRGVKSFGMICAADEIGLGDMFEKEDERTIVDLSHLDAKIGTPLADALGLDDVIVDVENKTITHRPDLWGHYGVAREVAAIYRKELSDYNPPAIKEGKEKNLKVDIQAKEHCARASFVALSGIKIEPSPDWLQKRLSAIGVRPINNIVDITNYVMLDLGQPMHAHDANKLAGETVVIRFAEKGEKFVTLDHKEYELEESMLVIADNTKAVALAGVMGGEESDIDDDTTDIVLEAANFDATTVRKAAQKCALRTDASARFEKSLDPHMTELALRRAVQLILEICPNAAVTSNVADAFHGSLDQGPIDVSMEFIQKKMGVPVETKQAVDTLERLGFDVKEKKDMLTVKIPTWRATKDVSIKEDLVEEVARMFGYNNIPTSLPSFDITPAPENKLRDLSDELRKLLAYEGGYTEVYNYSFVSPELLAKMGEGTSSHIELEHPIAKDRPFVRRNLVPNLLENVEKNQHRFNAVRLFELGKTFLLEEAGERAEKNSDNLLPKQDVYLGMVYAEKGIEKPFYDVSSTFAAAMDRLGCDVTYKKATCDAAFVHPGRYAEVYVGDTMVGRIAEVHPTVQSKLGLDHRTAVLQVNMNVLVELVSGRSSYEALPLYPAVTRDIALTVDSATEHTAMQAAMKKASKLLVDAELFDVYEGGHVESGKKSVAYHLAYRNADKTLEAKEVEGEHEKVLAALKKMGAELRS